LAAQAVKKEKKAGKKPQPAAVGKK